MPPSYSTFTNTASSSSFDPPRGTYCPASKSDLRGPCPLINSLANHGYIPRDGREVHAPELTAALSEVGLSHPLRVMFSNPIFEEHRDPNALQQPAPKKSFVARLIAFFRNPWSILSKFGMRSPGQVDGNGKKCLDIDQLAIPGVVEHNISLTRKDYAEGDNYTRQPALVSELLSSSSDGKTLTKADLARYRVKRIEEQKAKNPGLTYGKDQHQVGCGEIALILGVFGDGERIPIEFVKAFFAEERLPVKEGWRKRGGWFGWTMGILEFKRATDGVKALIGLKF